MNLSVKERLEKAGADFVYKEGLGGHNWDFWDDSIKHILNWMFHRTKD